MADIVVADIVTDGDLGLFADFDNRFSTHDDRSGIDRHAVKSLPVINISPLFDGGHPAACTRVAREIRNACINSVFLYYRPRCALGGTG